MSALLIVTLLGVNAQAAVVVDNVSTVFDDGNPTSLTVAHTTSAGSDRLMIVGVSLLNENLESVTAVTYNGIGLTFIGQISQGNDSRVELWSLLNPPVTTANVIVSFNEVVQSGAGAGVITYTGVDQVNPYGPFQSNSGDSTTATALVLSAPGEIVLGVMAAERQDNNPAVVGGTAQWAYKTAPSANRTAGAGATFAGASSVNLAWNLNEPDDWAVGAISIREVGAAILSCDTFRDEFSSVSYSRQDGTANWSLDWNEVGDNGVPNNGTIRINSASLRLAGNGSSATVLGGPYIEREADLSGYTAAILSFDYRETGGWEPSDDIEIYVSDDGGASWNLIQTFTDDQGGTFQGFASDISAYMSSNTRIAFVEKANANNERFFFDNVQILACNTSLAPIAYYEMNEPSWNGTADEVIDSSGNGNDGTAVGTANTVDPGKICLGGDIPFNTSDAAQDAIDTELDMDTDIGTTGTISFWYKPDTAWTGGGDRMLVDASTTADNKYFFLALLNNGALRFRFEDSIDADFQLDTTSKAFPAGEWHHIAVTWDLPGDRLEIYIDGVLDASSTPNTSGSWGALGTVYLGDNRSTYHPSGTPNSANGVLDEARIYNAVQSAAEIQTDMNATGSCLTAYAWFQLDATPGTWNGTAGEVVDQQATVTTAMALGTGAGVNSIATPICRGIDIPLNTTNAAQYGFDSTIDLNDDIGNSGTISFWYKSNNAWAGGADRALFDASPDSLSNPDKFFLLMLRNDGALQFAVEDSTDADFLFNTAVQGFAANAWVHVAVTWNMSGNRQIFINGALAATDTSATSGALGELDTIYFGDNRSTYHFGGTANSANGVIDEVRVYNSVLTLAQINTDLNATHTCAGGLTDHFSIAHDGSAINCQAENITLSAHTAAGPHNVDIAYTGTVTLSVDTAHGDWSYVSGGNPANLNNLGNGGATYLFDGSESGSVVLALANTFAELIDIDASDGTFSETSGTADGTDDPPLTYDPSGFSFLANGVASTIGTQISGKGSNVGYGAQVLELEAINTNTLTGACEAALNGVVMVELAFECENANTCQRPVYIGGATPSTPVNGTNTDVVNPLNYTNVALDFGTVADTTATFVLNYPDAGQIQLHARYALLPSNEDLLGPSNSFVVRPFGFDVSVTHPMPPHATTHAGFRLTTAGTAFTVNASAVLWNSVDDDLGASDGIPDNHDDTDPSNNDDLSGNSVTLGGMPYTGAPNFGQESEDIELTALLFAPAGGFDPGLPANTLITSFAAGAGSNPGVIFNEVGIIEIAADIDDLDYLGIGGAETALMASKSGHVGRFYPATLSITATVNGDFINTNVAGAVPFTYTGQNFTYDAIHPSFVVSALSALATVTRNYTDTLNVADDWAKLVAGDVTFTVPTADNNQLGSDGLTLMAVTYVPDLAGFTLTDNGNGTHQFEFPNDQFRYDKDSNSEIPPFNPEIDLDITDVTDGDLVTTPPGTTTLTPDGSAVEIRFGRLRMENAFGSELNDLIMNYHIEYYDEIGITPFWTLHDDADSTILIGDITAVPGNTSAVAINPTTPLGKFELTLAATLIDVTETITTMVDTSGESWLQYDWDQDGLFDNNPSALATFGIFEGAPVQIYIQQIYQ